jgi:D-glycero-alpha-D-manno-heptose-7-phosphate kinase
MIVTKTPLRISFFSGGSDMPSFYEKEDGAALSVAINKFVYVFTHRTQYTGVKRMYDDVEEHNDLDMMQHAITRESLKDFGIDKEITVASISDIFAKGSGLGSSSAFTVGLVKALSAVRSEPNSRDTIAEIACDIEMNRCGYPVGKQDQYAAAYGGMNLFEFKRNGKVEVQTINITKPSIEKLESKLMLVYSGKGRDANNILQKQQKAMIDIEKFNLVKKAKDKAYTAMNYLNKGDLDSFGNMFHEAWLDKKKVCSDISQDYFDNIYNKVVEAGAFGGKLLGAGGGGFFLFYVPEKERESVAWTLKKETECKIYDFQFYGSGSSVVYYS